MVDLWQESGEISLACAFGLAPYASREAKGLGYRIIREDESSVVVAGTMCDAMRLNLWLRTATRVLWSVGEFQAKTIEHLYHHVASLPWEAWLAGDGFFTVHGAVRNDTVRDTRLPLLRTKDAIVDRLREAYGQRPDSGSGFHGASIFILWQERKLRLFIDTTGESLSRRGYRLHPGAAPLQETLAAAAIMASGWDWNAPFVAPMCGSGTPAIEAAMITRRRAPGLLRSHFSFQALRGYHAPSLEGGAPSPPQQGNTGIPACEPLLPASAHDSQLAISPAAFWQAECAAARAAERPQEAIPPIIASDISPAMIRQARENSRRAGVDDLITFETCDFAETTIPPGFGVLFLNPEYGQRLSEREALRPLYRRLGEFIDSLPDYRTALITDSPMLARELGREPQRRFPFFNGPLDCRLLAFEARNIRHSPGRRGTPHRSTR